MPFRDQTDHIEILDTYHRYGRVDSIDAAMDEADVTLLDGLLAPTEDVLGAIPIFYHCHPDAELRENGALVGAAQAFRVGDTAVIRFENGTPLIVAIRNLLRRCGAPGAVLQRGTTIYLGTFEGNPMTGSARITEPWEWGTAKHLCFGCPDVQLNRFPFTIIDRYWILDTDGEVYFRSGATVATEPREDEDEEPCSGLPENITAISVQIYDWTRYLVLSRRQDGNEYVDQYANPSGDCVTWVFEENIFSAPYTGITDVVHNVKAAVGAGYWLRWSETQDREAYHLDHFYEQPPGHPEGYPSDYFRIWRIGIRQYWNDYGEPANNPRAFTCIADSYPTIQLTFEFENYWDLEGLPLDGTQLLQLWGDYWSKP